MAILTTTMTRLTSIMTRLTSTNVISVCLKIRTDSKNILFSIHDDDNTSVGRGTDISRDNMDKDDDEVDELYNQVFRDLLNLIIKDQHAIDQSTYLLWAAHNLERTADRAVNICERVVFTATGQLVEMNNAAEIK